MKKLNRAIILNLQVLTVSRRRSSKTALAAALVSALFSGASVQAADTVYTATQSSTNWSALTLSPAGTPGVGDVVLGNTAATNFTTTIDTAVTIGGLRLGTSSSSTVWTIAAGAGSLTLDGTGLSAGNSAFGNAGVAFIAPGANGSSSNSIAVGANISMASDLDIGSTGAAGAFSNVSGAITNGTAGPLNLNIRVNNTGTSNGGVISGAIGATGSGIAISNLGTATAGQFTISGALGAQVTSVTQNSAGTKLILTGANGSFTGPINIKAGTLRAGSAAGNTLGTGLVTLGDSTVGANATLEISDTVTSTGGLTVASGAGTRTISYVAGNSRTFSDVITLNNSLTLLNATGVGLTMNQAINNGSGSGNNITIQSNGSAGNGGNFTISGAVNNAGTISNTGTATVAGTNNISGVIGANVTGIIQNSANSILQLSGVNTNFAGTATVTTGTLRLGNGSALNVNNAVTVNGGVFDLNGQNAVTIGSLAGSGGVIVNNSNTARTLTLGGNATTSYSGTLSSPVLTSPTISSPSNSGILNLTVGTGSSTTNLTLSGSNAHTGLTTVAAGSSLTLGNVNALGNGGYVKTSQTGGTTVSAGGTLDLNGQSGVNEVITLNGTGVGGNGALVNNSGTAASIGDGVSSLNASGTLTGLTGGTTVSLTGGGGSGAAAVANLGVTAATFGTVTVTGTYTTAPTVTITGGGGTGATATVSTSGVLTITNAGTGYTSAPTITFTGGVGGTSMTATANNTNFTLNGIAITSNGSGYTSTPTVALSSGTATTTANLSSVVLGSASSIGGSGNLTINPVISGGFALTKVGSGTTTLAGANTYSGATTISAGALQLGNGGTTGSLAAGSTITNNGSLIVNRSNAVVQGTDFSTAAINGSGSVTQAGSGTTTFNAANGYTGGTTINNGTLSAANNSALGTGAVTVNSGGTLLIQAGFNIANTVTVAGGSYNKNINSGAAYSYAAASSFAGGTPDTTASLIAGTTGAARSLSTSFAATSSAANDGIRSSDVFNLSGTGTDIFTLQLQIASIPANAILGWNNAGTWVDAVSGNSLNNASGGQLGYAGSFSSFQGTYGTTLSSYLGAYGIDTTNNTVWAVLDHNSEFSVIAVPEPSTYVLLGMGLASLLVLRRKSRKA